MLKNAKVPNAWDDDWEAEADRMAGEETKSHTPPPLNLSRSERLAEHAEANRKLWESAETPQTFHYVEATNHVPLASAFKPQVKVLSRKPVVAKKDPATGLSQLTLDDDGDEGNRGADAAMSVEEIRAKQKREREEKQRRYDEARAKIFGENASSSRGSSPVAVTPPTSRTTASLQGRGRGRTGQSSRGTAGFAAPMTPTASDNRQPFEGRRPTTQSAPSRELYDPNFSPRPDSGTQRKGVDEVAVNSLRHTTRDEGVPIRSPRGPDGSGRGGFGFARRDAKDA